MKFKSTWIVIAVFLGLGAYFYFVEEPRHEARQEAEERSGLLFPGLEPDAVTELSLEKADGKVRLKRGEGDRWFLVEPWDDRAEDGRVRTLLSDLEALKGTREVAGADADLAPFGLAEPAVKVTATAGAARRELAVGETNPSGDARYARAGEGAVQLVSAAGVSALLGEPSELRSKEVLEGFPWTRLASLELRPSGGVAVRLVRKGEGWVLEAPLETEADADAVGRLTEKVRWSRISRFLDEDPADAETKLAAGTAVTLRAEGGDEVTLRLADVEGAVWAARTGRQALFVVGRDVLEAVQAPAEALRRRKPVLVRSWKADRLELSLGGPALSYEKGDGAWQREGAPVEGEEATALQEYLRALDTGEAVEVLDAAEGVAAYGLDTPGLTATVVDTDGAEQRLAAARRGEEVFARGGGEGPVYRMPAEYWEKAEALARAAAPQEPAAAEAPPSGAEPE